MSDSQSTCFNFLEPSQIPYRLINTCESHSFIDYLDAAAVLLAALFAGASAICAWKANNSFKKQAAAEQFDKLIGDEFYRALTGTRALYKTVRAAFTSTTMDNIKQASTVAAIRVVQGSNLYSVSQKLDEHSSQKNEFESICNNIDTQLSALVDIVQQQNQDWHTRAQANLSAIEGYFSDVSSLYIKVRKQLPC